MAKTPNKSDAKGGAGVIRLYPHKGTQKAIERQAERLASGKLKTTGRLTAKQEAFAQAMHHGLTQADAIRQCYNVENSSPQSIYAMGKKNMNNTLIAARIVELRELEEADARLDKGNLKAFVIENLKKESLEANSPGARVRALELLGKLTEVQAFADVSIDRTPTRTEAEIEADIADLLERLQPQR